MGSDLKKKIFFFLKGPWCDFTVIILTIERPDTVDSYTNNSDITKYIYWYTKPIALPDAANNYNH